MHNKFFYHKQPAFWKITLHLLSLCLENLTCWWYKYVQEKIAYTLDFLETLDLILSDP